MTEPFKDYDKNVAAGMPPDGDTGDEIFTTEHDVALDVLAALDMYTGSCGSDDTVIESVDESDGDPAALVLSLSNGDRYQVRIREIKPDKPTKKKERQ